MAVKFKKGDTVRQVVPVIEGAVKSLAIVDDEVQYEVEYVGDDGETHRRFFTEEQVEAVPAAE